MFKRVLKSAIMATVTVVLASGTALAARITAFGSLSTIARLGVGFAGVILLFATFEAGDNAIEVIRRG